MLAAVLVVWITPIRGYGGGILVGCVRWSMRVVLIYLHMQEVKLF